MRLLSRVLLSIIFCGISLAQQYQPSVDFTGLMNLRFYNQSGGFMIENLTMIFPPDNYNSIEFEITTPSGESEYKTGLRLQKWDNLPAFANLAPNGPGIVHLEQTGNFIINIKVDSMVISRLPFTLKAEKNGDPFNPKVIYVREGPWKNLAYFSYEKERPGYLLKFNWWMNSTEVGSGKNAKITVHLMKGNKEIARSRGEVVVSDVNWQEFNYNLVTVGKKFRQFTINDLTKENGNYSVVLRADGKPFKTYSFTVSGGKVKELPQNNLDYSPHEDFIASRVLDRSSGSNSSYKILNAVWVTTKN